MRGLAGQVVAVTGAGGGIGLAVCERLREEGATVYALDLAADPNSERELSVDVTNPDSLAGARDQIIAREGKVDSIVAAAGVVEDDVAAEDMAPEEFDRTMNVNLRGVFFHCTDVR
ncbi:SDR family NAD(P)-dependent oxidoreductase [Leucobacter komagatae]|uniref:SDR family NAD(P)-dependent oxidoreductase n=1 Tax=Leucobacter komagatae TaxID=55969 RepID=UPI0018DD3697|nr:SDR family NAD(P)-dependent oxidoreductase [Leucobacter komagatae]